MRQTCVVLSALVLGVAATGLVSLGVPANADDAVGQKLDAILASLARVEERLGVADGRLERLEARLADVEVFLQRFDERQSREAAPPAPDGQGQPSTPVPPTTGSGERPVEITQVLLRNRRLVTAPETGDEYLVFDVDAVVKNLQRAGRLRTRFHLTDRFGTTKRSIDWTTGVLRTGDRIVERNMKIRVTRSAPEDLWLRAAPIREMGGRFDVIEVLYGVELQDGGPVPK